MALGDNVSDGVWSAPVLAGGKEGGEWYSRRDVSYYRILFACSFQAFKILFYHSKSPGCSKGFSLNPYTGQGLATPIS